MSDSIPKHTPNEPLVSRQVKQQPAQKPQQQQQPKRPSSSGSGAGETKPNAKSGTVT